MVVCSRPSGLLNTRIPTWLALRGSITASISIARPFTPGSIFSLLAGISMFVILTGLNRSFFSSSIGSMPSGFSSLLSKPLRIGLSGRNIRYGRDITPFSAPANLSPTRDSMIFHTPMQRPLGSTNPDGACRQPRIAGPEIIRPCCSGVKRCVFMSDVPI